MKILTGNDLKNGRVVWWDGQGWSIHVEDAIDVGDQADNILAREDAACRVNGGYAIEAEPDPSGRGVRPAHIKDRVRAYGPTVRPDLTLKPADPNAGSWVICCTATTNTTMRWSGPESRNSATRRAAASKAS